MRAGTSLKKITKVCIAQSTSVKGLDCFDPILLL